MEQVYIFDFGDKIKVGYSTNVKKRLRTIELSSGVRAKQSYAVEASRDIEKLAHSWLTNRLEGEFFAFPFDKAKEIVDDIVQGKITSPPVKRVSDISNKKGHITYSKLFALLEEKGYTSYRIRKEKVLGQATLTAIKNGTGGLDHRSIARLCEVLGCQPGDIMEYLPDDEEK